MAPRIGLRSPSKSKYTAFKPPLIAAPQVVSSPPISDHHPPLLRPSARPYAARLKTSGMRKQKRAAELSSDPMDEGESFDSFDGMMEAGGADVEALLRQIDGTQAF